MADEAIIPVSVEHGKFTVTSNTAGTPEALKEGLEERFPEEKAKGSEEEKSEQISHAAKKLGSEGGKATAKRKAETREEKPEEKPDDKKASEAEEDEGDRAKRELEEELEKADPKGRKRLASDRVREAVRENAATKRENKELRAKHDALLSRLDDLERRLDAPPPKTEVPAAPDPKDFEGKEDELQQRRIEHEVERRLAERDEARVREEARTRSESRIGELEGNLQDSFEAARNADPEFDSKLSETLLKIQAHWALPQGERPQVENFIISEIYQSEDPAMLALHFSEHPEDWKRVAAQRSHRDVTREMTRLTDKLFEGATTGSPPPERAESEAPPPVKPVNGAPHQREEPYVQGESFDDYFRRHGHVSTR